MTSERRLVRALAPAKINWTLEVLGRRDNTYHEIRSVMQTIDLCDEVAVEAADDLRLEIRGPHEAREDDLALKAARLLADRVGRRLPALVRIQKRIPVAAGLGGGSSDAAAVLRGLNALYGLGFSREDLAAVGEDVGSDAPFFVYGGTALAEGRGERITVLSDVPAVWLVVLAPPLRMAEKTKRMYEALRVEDFVDGRGSEALAERSRRGESVREEVMHNAFDGVAEQVFPGIEDYRRAFLQAGAGSVHLCGAGPAMFAPAEGEDEARAIAKCVEARRAKVFVARTLGAREATAVVGE